VSRSLQRQDGFAREVLQLALIVAVVAFVFLDALALFNAHRTVEDSAAAAALEARNVYYETQDVAGAKRAAQASLKQNGKEFVGLDTSRSLDGTLVFSVSAKGHADTYAFKYLGYVGLKDWVERVTDPTSTQSSK